MPNRKAGKRSDEGNPRRCATCGLVRCPYLGHKEEERRGEERLKADQRKALAKGDAG